MRHVPLSSIATFASGGTPAKTEPSYWNGSIKWLTPKDMPFWDGQTADRVSELALGKGTRLAPAGSIFIAVRGMSLHTEIRILHSKEALAFNQDIKAINASKSVNQKFLYYCLQAQKDYLLSCVEAAGHGTGRLPSDRLKSVPILDIDRFEQDRLASLFSCLDDKIDLNRQMNETLEAMARALFKDWFVDFGPTRAKMAGQKPYLAQDIWDLFPDRLDDKGKPEGWVISQIGNEATIVGGSTPSTAEPSFWDGFHAWATPKDLSGLSSPVISKTVRTITDNGLSCISSGLLPAGSVLLSSRAPVGYTAITTIPMAINQGFIGVICNKIISPPFVLFWMKESMDLIVQHANGSTFQEISKKNFRPLPLIKPAVELLQKYSAIVQPLIDKIIQNEAESKALAQMRDLLLPKLMSGEIRIKDAEKMVEEVA
ncbi:restriction endonuclease subunit S [Asaia siamensis]|uniref:Type I restriction system specificity protein n=1 Tax=Asaia siamensis TaxID=110479 RepID=A0ABQ1MK91_9PROT|nr:restriction endonuclease subunit S [Asaia siamensis]GBR07103.1 restriction endonuclease S subunit [Asaia siamensis NRIC 0323]GGC41984.1 type I restriction system specificity protein [Asaia siamensis]